MSDAPQKPEDFIITRKRKLYKFAKFRNDPRCFSGDEFRENSSKLIDSKEPLVLEIGAGTGLFSVELATRNPDKTFVAIDKKSDRLWQGAREANARNLTNFFCVYTEVKNLERLFEQSCVDTIWITFPDPFAKDKYQEKRGEFSRFFSRNLRFENAPRHAENLENYKREIKGFDDESRKNFTNYLRKNDRGRLSAKPFLETYEQLLRSGGELSFKTDNSPLFEWSLQQFTESKWQINELSRDLHGDQNIAENNKIKTIYEARFTREFLPISFVNLSPPK